MVFGTDTLNRFGCAEFDRTAAYNLTSLTPDLFLVSFSGERVHLTQDVKT